MALYPVLAWPEPLLNTHRAPGGERCGQIATLNPWVVLRVRPRVVPHNCSAALGAHVWCGPGSQT